jgi:hypothetical protein
MRGILVGQAHASLRSDLGDAIDGDLEVAATIDGAEDVGKGVGGDWREGLEAVDIGRRAVGRFLAASVGSHEHRLRHVLSTACMIRHGMAWGG